MASGTTKTVSRTQLTQGNNMAVVAPPGATLITTDQDVPTPENLAPAGATPVEQPDIDPDSFFGRVGEKIGKRIEKVERGSEMYSEGEISYPEFALRGLGFAYGSLWDTIGEAGMTVLKELTPDAAEDFLAEQIAAGGTTIMNTEQAQKALALYQGLDQRSKDNIGDIFDVALGALPKSKVGKTLMESGIKADKAKLSKAVLSQTDSVKKARAVEEGLPKNMQSTLNREDAILNTVLGLPGVSGSSSRKKIMSALNKHIGVMGERIRKSLRQSDVIIPPQSVNTQVTKAFADFVRSNPEYATKHMKGSIAKIQDAYRVAFRDFKGKPEELLEMRQRFDKITEKLFKKDLHAGDDASRELVANVRNSINTIMEGVAPDEQIKAAMRSQHHALMARETLGYNIAKEGSLISQAIDTVSRHPFMAISGAMGTGAVARLAGSEAGAIGAAGLGAAYGLTQPIVRKAAGAALDTVPVGRGMLYGVGSELQDEIQGP